MLPTILALIATVVATPVSIASSESAVVATRQLISDRTSLTENQFSRRIGGGCRDVIFVWARGSTELGNMVSWHTATETLPTLTLAFRALSLGNH